MKLYKHPAALDAFEELFAIRPYIFNCSGIQTIGPSPPFYSITGIILYFFLLSAGRHGNGEGPANTKTAKY